jgi:hypothetical protein
MGTRESIHGRATDMMQLWGGVFALLLLVTASGCTIDDLLRNTEVVDGGVDGSATQAGLDATATDAKGVDDAASADGPRTVDGAPTDVDMDAGQSGPEGGGLEAGNADAGANTTYYAVDDPSRWAFFPIGGVANGTTKYSGVAFDGRFLYFVPNFSPPNVLRYDTQGGFTDPTAWTYYAPMAAITAAGGSSTGSYTFLGGAFDGRYVYLAPFGTNSYVVQYDTTQPFSHDGSWSAFNAATLDPSANYWGVISDGRYAYFVPNKTTKVVAYDNTAGGDAGSNFSSAASFTVYDLGSGNQGFWGGTFDGTYVYLAPFSGSVVARHDALLPVTAAWDVGATGFDLNNNFLLGAVTHFWGAAYDGNRVYVIPNGSPWTLAAYSTSGQFSDYGSWETCAIGTQLFGGQISGSPYVGAAFDGKRLFIVPYGSPGADGGTTKVPLIAFDTTQDLCPSDVNTAYTTFDPTGVDGGTNAVGFEGAAFDGKYVYFVPHTSNVAARFEAKSVNTGLSPSVYKGSWW